MEKLYRRIPYLLTIVVIITIAMQLFWGYSEYQKNSAGFKSEIQQALDVALDNYFVAFTKESSISVKAKKGLVTESSIINVTGNNPKKIIDKIRPESINEINVNKLSDSLKMIDEIKDIYISVTKDSINFKKLKTLLDGELNRKGYAIPYTLNYYKKDSLFATANKGTSFSKHFSINGKSTYLKTGERIELQFPDAVVIILKKSLLSVFLSLLLTIAILFALFYMLWIMKKQKQLAEIKNDLISNITHEFKTPISTIGAALESIRNFNANNDIEKTNRYLDYSNQQLEKLGKMVDKLMDTALLDTNNWVLNRQTIDVKDWATAIVENYKLNSAEKNIVLHFYDNSKKEAFIDPFHLENAFGALLDNALKYGGDQIEISVENKETFSISVSDNGNSLNKEQATKVFEKFYRVPQGNIHDVKGTGIGLYHVKKIAEKHRGTSKVSLKNNATTFTISIPNE
ncbi:sensor histidine kinase [Flavobacterium luminosum]|uniref:histidine kinase n=1 Tax=Flavobacterium luminosum TaxID=2949086 RepID=A0ABT0TJS2_9FLAO|nr:HAMP domain-containing sensor histidine kinase [Flavobacterium sp. HXWNR70]MCL9807753.1 HAMP domain-containing histidine kinase [Flavobacterium sp. HXWNR70]